MNCKHSWLSFALFVALGINGSAASSETVERVFSFVYDVEVAAIAASEGPVDVFVPLAQSDDNQEVLDTRVEASIPGVEGTEGVYGNRFWHGHLERSHVEAVTVRVEYTVRRREVSNRPPPQLAQNEYSAEEFERIAAYLLPNERVPVSGELVDAITAEIAPGETDKSVIARAIYDYVIDNMEYKKVGDGWGNGDTYWACSARYGNCTDFHALFISLARARGIPARFSIGFLVPQDRPEGEIGGYHCWVEFYLLEVGWVPIDASEAKKHPEQRELLFGGHPPDRLSMTVGRDLELGDGHRTGPLNFFVYPFVEVGGEAFDGVTRRFTYQELSTTADDAGAESEQEAEFDQEPEAETTSESVLSKIGVPQLP